MRIISVLLTAFCLARPASGATHPDKSFVGPITGRTIQYAIHLPEEAGRDVRHPVIYWLHGATQEEKQPWTREIGFVAEALAAARRADATIRPMIIVAVNGHGMSQYVDYKGGEFLTETEIIRELLPHVEKTYPALPGRAGRALLGFSMGGCGSQMLAVKYPELFCIGISLDGPTQLDDWAWANGRALGGANPFAGDQEHWRRFSPVQLARPNADRIRGRVALRHYRASPLFTPALENWQRTCKELAFDFALIDLLAEIGKHSSGEIFRLRGTEIFRSIDAQLLAAARAP